MEAGAEQEAQGGCGRWAVVGLTIALLLGAFLRLVWVQDVEYKWDEFWTFQRTQHVGRDEPFPWLGMPTSYEVRHPGGTVWVFLALGRLFGVDEPTELARACQLLNVLALLLIVGFAYVAVPRAEREPWLWAAALAALNPVAVLLHRKIWPPSVVPLFAVLFLMAWWYRERRWGAAAWGLMGAILGQVHPAGLFFALGVAVWAFLFDRRRVAWWAWLAGSCVGALPLLPWLAYVGRTLGTNPIGQRHWTNLVAGKFWLRWVSEPFGFSLHYTLRGEFGAFLRGPVVSGVPTYLVGMLHVLLATAAATLLVIAARRLWRERGRWHELVVGRSSPTAFTLSAGMWGGGLALTASLLPIHRHYMPITFPLMFLWLAQLALHQGRTGRAFLAGLCVVQLLISLSFLDYVHTNQRLISIEYGVPYGAQARLLEARLAGDAGPHPVFLLGGLPPEAARLLAAGPPAPR
jgi:hypothetical protein